MLKSISTMSLAAAIVFATYLSASAAGKLDMIKTRGSIIVGIDFSHPPFGAINEKTEQVGSDLETAQLLAKDLGVKLETVNVSGPNRIPFLVTNKVDIVVASISITDERKKVIDISEPYGVVPLNVAGPAIEKIRSAADLESFVPGLDPSLVTAQLTALLPAFTGPGGHVGGLDTQTLAGWAAWEAKFGIVSRPPAVSRTFDPSLAAGAAPFSG